MEKEKYFYDLDGNVIGEIFEEGINAEEVKGFEKLNVNKDLFKQFCYNFYNAWGIDARLTIKPISVKYVNEKGDKYLRFDYKIYGRKEWLHVKSPTKWY